MKHHFKVLFTCTFIICLFVLFSINAVAQANVTIIDNTNSKNYRVIGSQKPSNQANLKSKKAIKANSIQNPPLQARSQVTESVDQKISKVKTKINEFVSKNCCIAEIEKLEKYLCDLESQK